MNDSKASLLVRTVNLLDTHWREFGVRDNGPGIAPEALPHLFESIFLDA